MLKYIRDEYTYLVGFYTLDACTETTRDTPEICKIFLCLRNVLIEAFHMYSLQKHVQVTLKHRYVNVFLSRYSGSENKNKEEELYTIFFTNLTNFIASLSAELLSKHQLMFPDH